MISIFILWAAMEKVTFDPIQKIISINLGVTELDILRDLYSAWKRWIIIGDNQKYLRAFRVVGGDELTATKTLGSTFFIMNGWRIKPPEENTALNIVGNFYSDDGLSPFVQTVGNYNSILTLTVSNLTDSQVVESEIAQNLDYQGVVCYDENSIYSTGDYPHGTVNMPVNNLNACVEIANRVGSKIISVRGVLNINQNMSDYTFRGKNIESYIFSNGFDLTDCQFESVRLTGNNFGRIRAVSCLIENSINLFGEFNQCGFAGNISLADEDSCFVLCFTKHGMEEYCLFDLSSCGSNSVCFRAYSGGMYISKANPQTAVEIDFISGKIIIDAESNNAVVIRGIAVIDNRSATALACDASLSKSEITQNILSANVSAYNDPDTFAGFIKNKVLTVAKFIGLQ